jgi:hypothetical protein
MQPWNEGGRVGFLRQRDFELGLEVGEGACLAKATRASYHLTQTGELGFQVTGDEFVFLDFLDVLQEGFVGSWLGGPCECHGLDFGAVSMEQEFRCSSGKSLVTIDASITPKTGRGQENPIQ